jgi:hypothetical protein
MNFGKLFFVIQAVDGNRHGFIDSDVFQELRTYGLHNSCHFGFFGSIGFYRNDFASYGLNRILDFFSLGVAMAVVYGNVCPFTCQSQRDGFAEPVAKATLPFKPMPTSASLIILRFSDFLPLIFSASGVLLTVRQSSSSRSLYSFMIAGPPRVLDAFK